MSGLTTSCRQFGRAARHGRAALGARARHSPSLCGFHRPDDRQALSRPAAQAARRQRRAARRCRNRQGFCRKRTRTSIPRSPGCSARCRSIRLATSHRRPCPTAELAGNARVAPDGTGVPTASDAPARPTARADRPVRQLTASRCRRPPTDGRSLAVKPTRRSPSLPTSAGADAAAVARSHRRPPRRAARPVRARR